MQIHGASAFVDGPGDISVDLNASNPEFVFVKVGFPGGFYMTVYGDDDADMVITKFLQAKDMHAAHRNAVANHAGIGEYVNGTGLPVAEDDGGDGDDDREPYCTVCLFKLSRLGFHLYPDDAIVAAHTMVLGWREPVGRPVTQAGRDLQAGSLAAEQTARDMENAQAAEVRRIGQLHTDGHITDAECAEMVDKVLGEHA